MSVGKVNLVPLPDYSAIEVRYWHRKTTREQYRRDIAVLLDRAELLEGRAILIRALNLPRGGR